MRPAVLALLIAIAAPAFAQVAASPSPRRERHPDYGNGKLYELTPA
jgi:hypothetical protein